MGLTHHNSNMKVLILAVLVSLASARPRYLVIDLDAMEENRPVEMMLPRLARQTRMAQEEDSYQSAPDYASYPEVQGRDSQGSPSNAYPAPAASAGPDHVDYGAYTGGYGAFGWYTDHPVL